MSIETTVGLTTGMLRFSIRSCFRMWIRSNREWEDSGRGSVPRYRRELCGFNEKRWAKATGIANFTFGKGIKEIFSNP